jgi:two-component system, OmpR family, response regulator
VRAWSLRARRFICTKHAGNVVSLASSDVDVVLLRWPAEATRRSDLARQGRPRLLFVEGDDRPPDVSDCLEDWVRVPASDADVKTRMAGLKERADRHGSLIPYLDEDGVLRHGSCWVPLPPVESRLTGALLERFGAVVSREHLAQVGWPEGAPGRNALDVHVLRLRRRINPLGLVIRTVRSRGYLLEGQVAA